MKTHLIKHKGLTDDYGWAVTYCNLHSEEWGEEFSENLEKNLTENIEECTCKRCLNAYKKIDNKGGLSQVDMLGEEWDWTYNNLRKMTDNEIYQLYNLCKDSWNRK